MEKIFNFSPGPGILPEPVYEKCAQAVMEFRNSGLSILEMSHRSKEIVRMVEEANSLVKELLQVPDEYKVLFLQGGASLQFTMVPANLLNEGDTAAYTDTGSWASKAIKEAKQFGKVIVTTSSKDSNYNHIPGIGEIDPSVRYLHLTSNNTIFGTQYREFPKCSVPLVGDMSSDIFSRPFDVSKFGLVYAGAQKNMGCAGVTLVLVREDMLAKGGRVLPSMLNYKLHIDNDSMYNTPPVFAIYTVLETLLWVKSQGGVAAMEKINQAKAAKLYAEIDSNPLFRGTAENKDRSLMNVTFVLTQDGKDEDFLSLTKKYNLSHLKGHRSVGGFRASIYNAMPEAGVDALIDCMREYSNG